MKARARVTQKKLTIEMSLVCESYPERTIGKSNKLNEYLIRLSNLPQAYPFNEWHKIWSVSPPRYMLNTIKYVKQLITLMTRYT
jgi:hypothetical protein